MGTVDPRFNFEFDIVDKGEYAFVVKETAVEPPKDGQKSGRRFWARLVVESGEEEGKSHMESFFETTKEDFSFSKLAGFLYKLGFIPTLGKINTDIFKTPEFEERWKKSVPGLKMGGKIGHRTKDKDGKLMDKVQSELRAYYTYAEIRDILAKKSGEASPLTPSVTTLGGTAVSTPGAAPKAPWD